MAADVCPIEVCRQALQAMGCPRIYTNLKVPDVYLVPAGNPSQAERLRKAADSKPNNG